jgi:hypothetical protein
VPEIPVEKSDERLGNKAEFLQNVLSETRTENEPSTSFGQNR